LYPFLRHEKKILRKAGIWFIKCPKAVLQIVIVRQN
jgi:hypothetical protein